MDQQDTSKFNASLRSLPTENHHIIFDYIDTRTLVQSVPYVCKTLYQRVKNYEWFKLHYISSSESEIKIKMTSRSIDPANIISFPVSNELERLSFFNQCTGFRSLVLREADDLERFWPLLDNNQNRLSSLPVEFRQWPYLKTISLQHCIMNSENETISTSFPSEILSLPILDCSLSIKNLHLILWWKPALIYLKLISSKSVFNAVFDSSVWERCIISQLKHWIKLTFLFSLNEVYGISYTRNRGSIISSFQTPFWLEDKHWFVTCNFLMWWHKKLKISTTSICMTNSEDSMRFEVSSRNGVRRFTQRSSAVAIDFNEDEVCMHVYALHRK